MSASAWRLLASILFFGPASSWATSCVEPTEEDIDVALHAAVDQSDFVFFGKPIGLRSDLGPTDVQVLRVWKGPNLSEIPVRGANLRSEGNVFFANRATVGGWQNKRPSCLFLSDVEIQYRLSEMFGEPGAPNSGNRENYEFLIVVSIFVLLGFIAIAVSFGASLLAKEI